MNIVKKILGKIHNLSIQYSNLCKYMRSGGVVYANVSFVNPSNRFRGKTVVVTGGYSGIGLEIVKEFLSEGAHVIATGRSEAKLQELKDLLNSHDLDTVSFDISCVNDINRGIRIISLLGRDIDIFINNAGVYDDTQWDRYDEEMFDRIHETNEKGLFFICQAEGKYMRDANIRGKIINITSVAGVLSGFNPYSISKWEANCITKGLAQTLIPYGIVVNAVAPGNVITNISKHVRGRSVNDNAYIPSHKTNRFVLVEEVASMVLFLSSDSANNIVGQVIVVDGGWSLQ